MQPTRNPYQTEGRRGLLGPAMVGVGLALTGLCYGLLAISTPFASRFAAPSGSAIPMAASAWGLALVAGGGLLIAGTHRLAGIAAIIRHHAGRSIVRRATGDRPLDIEVALNVVPGSGRPIPELVSGPFGLAVVHELATVGTLRQIGTTWEVKTSGGWAPTELPVDRASRDAERVRHWLTEGDLDFVVRVYAAVVTADTSLARSPDCAVLSEAQIPEWLAALRPQRSLTPARRERLSDRVANASQLW